LLQLQPAVPIGGATAYLVSAKNGVRMRILNNLLQHFYHSFRAIRRSKGIALGVVISMGLGIGVTACVFSFVDYFALRPLPVPETNRVVRIVNATPTDRLGSFSYPEYRDYVDRGRTFEGIAAYQNVMVGLAINRGDQPRVAGCMIVTGIFFRSCT
jgi:putative ABC transport system permease protein